MPDGLSISLRVFSTRLPSRQFGDVKIEWDEKDHEAIVAEIQALMDQDIHFFVIEPAKGRRKEKVVEVTDLAKQSGSRQLFAKDPHLIAIAQSPVARIATLSGVSEIKTIRKATDATDAAQNDTVGVTRGRGG